MSKRNIDLLKAMRTFLTVVEQMSFSAASRELNLVTSAVSRQVSDLEQHFDCQLLYRTTRAMHLTNEGEYYYEQFKAIVQQLDQLESSVSERQEKIAGHLRITAPMNISRLGIQRKISAFLKQYPDVTLSWILVNRYVNLIEEGIDLAIRVGELEDSGYIARPYQQLQVMYVANPDYLAQIGTPQHPSELTHHSCIIDTSVRQPGRWRYQDKQQIHSISLKAALEVNQGGLVAEFAAAGHGIAHLPDFLVQDYLEKGELVSILQAYQLPDVPVSLVYPANKMKNPALTQLVEHLLLESRA